MKRYILAVLALVLMTTGCAVKSGDVLKDDILPDFMAMAETENENNALYEEAMLAAEKALLEPNEENKEAFFETEQRTSASISANSNPKSALDESAADAMKKYDISAEDYNAFFEMFPLNMQDYTDWEAFKTLINSGDIASAESNLKVHKAMYEFSKEIFLYGIMDLFAGTSDEEFEDIRGMVEEYQYIAVEGVQWTNDRDEIEALVEEAYNVCEEAVYRFGSEVQERENELLDLNRDGN